MRNKLFASVLTIAILCTHSTHVIAIENTIEFIHPVFPFLLHHPENWGSPHIGTFSSEDLKRGKASRIKFFETKYYSDYINPDKSTTRLTNQITISIEPHNYDPCEGKVCGCGRKDFFELITFDAEEDVFLDRSRIRAEELSYLEINNKKALRIIGQLHRGCFEQGADPYLPLDSIYYYIPYAFDNYHVKIHGPLSEAKTMDAFVESFRFNEERIFHDIPTTHPLATSIGYVKDKGIVQGYPDGTYRPDSPINRAEFTKIVAGAVFDEKEILQCPALSSVLPFPDVSVEDWFHPYICTARKHGLIDGYPLDGMFHPAKSINFAEAAKIIVEAFDLEYTEITRDVSPTAWFQQYVDALEELDAVPKTIDVMHQEITRGEMAEMIYRLHSASP